MRIVLVGLMGAGKTTVGRALAARLGWAFLDLDDLIEQEAGQTVADLFAREGEAGFRTREEQALATALTLERVVLATGGGAVLSARNRQRLAAEPWVFWLEAPPDELARRLAGPGAAARPLLAGATGRPATPPPAGSGAGFPAGSVGADVPNSGRSGEPGAHPARAGGAGGAGGPDAEALVARLAGLLQQRQAAYAAVARHRIPTAGRSVDQVVTGLLETLQASGWARPVQGPSTRPYPAPVPDPDLVIEAGPDRYPLWVRPGTVGPVEAAGLEVLVAAVAGLQSGGGGAGPAGSSGMVARSRGGGQPPASGLAPPEPGERAPVALLVSDPVVAALYGHGVAAALDQAGFHVVRAVVPAGEEAKSLHWASALYDRLLEAGAGRDAWVFALGGGVVGDLAGFVAATYMRGIAFAQLPTTLLAQVDASAGGKVAVNHPRAKNLIGAFHQPRLVVADPATLVTQPWPAYRGGLAEMVKHALLDGEDHLASLEAAVPRLRERDPHQLAPLIARSVAVKARIVAVDPEERGPRAFLNLGHTFAHALEAATGYRVPHGDAVAAGLALALALSERLGMIPAGLAARVQHLLARLGLPVTLAEACRAWDVPPPEAAAVLGRLLYDKKNRRGRVRFVLLGAPGQVTLRDDVPPALVEELVRRSLAGGPPA
ncbi:3-dehydroquinate synthase [Thermaerobacter marianensis DSM 12885]|uniref:Multifunctional fusion protein n=1 Tax=Thermaerobacter marianensis (strain ATCC 700841 / DSM 12885 / JCM 10246 / 7p75a) TaxID=644966 RepID=E6SM12_THEM7|nr:3-dehydroquinate synthase [Thermaerobacter marianensis DSM 12885]